MATTLSKLLVELSADEHHPDAVKCEMHSMVEVAGQPVTTPSISAVQRAPTDPTTQPSVALTTPKQAAACNQQMTPAPADVQPRLAELMLHFTNLVISVRHHNILLNRCKYNHNDVTG